MSPNKDPSAEETEIRTLLAGWVEAFRRKDVEKLASYYVLDFRAFDLPPPLEILGLETNRKNWAAWFSSFESGLDYEIRDLALEADGKAAFSASLNRFGGKKKGEEPFEIWVRVTMGYRKEAGRWRITHEHVSVPFYMDGSFRAAADLRP